MPTGRDGGLEGGPCGGPAVATDGLGVNAPDGRCLGLTVIGRSSKKPEPLFLTAPKGAFEPGAEVAEVGGAAAPFEWGGLVKPAGIEANGGARA